MDLPDFRNLKRPEQTAKVLQEWRNNIPRLLVFDECDDEGLLNTWRPTSGGCRILLTSHRTHWSPWLKIQKIQLDVLSREESITLLRKYRPELSEKDTALSAIANELGDLPLALHLAGSFLKDYQDDPGVGSPTAFLSLLSSQDLPNHPIFRNPAEGTSPTGHEQSIERSFLLNYNRLDATVLIDALARQLLSCAACFAPGELIPLYILQQAIEVPADERIAARNFNDARKRLIGLGLIEEVEIRDVPERSRFLRLHRLFAWVVQHAITLEAEQAYVERALIIAFSDSSALPKPDLIPHLRYIADITKVRKDECAAELCTLFGRQLYTFGDYTGARPYLERTLFIREQLFGETDLGIVLNLNHLAELLVAQRSESDHARLLLERAITICEAKLDSEHGTTSRQLLGHSLENLAWLSKHKRNYDAARQYLIRALEIFENFPEDRTTDILQILHELANLSLLLAEYLQAKDYINQALEKGLPTLGEQHLLIKILYSNMEIIQVEVAHNSAMEERSEINNNSKQNYLG